MKIWSKPWIEIVKRNNIVIIYLSMQIFNTNKNKVINEPIFDAILNANNISNENDYYPFNI